MNKELQARKPLKLFHVLKAVITRLVELYRRTDPIKYAIGKGVKVGKGCRFTSNPNWGSEPYLITIGDHVLISGEVVFVNHDGATWVFRETEPYKDTCKFGPIVVGNNCFLGYRSLFLPNVTIGDNCVIAAGSVVTKNVPDGEVWGGVPAHFICKTEDYANKCYNNRLSYDLERMKKDKRAEMIRVIYGKEDG